MADLPEIAATAEAIESWSVAFAGSPSGHAAATVDIAAPWLGGTAREELFQSAQAIEVAQNVRLFRSGGLLLGHARDVVTGGNVSARTETLYQRMLKACAGRHLFRIWNYVPRINAVVDGLENYRAFCQGRSLAFESGFGRDFAARLPAASAVGCGGDYLDVIFVAGETVPTHYENPVQVPAYLYPIEYGPRAPSFARATVAQNGGRELIFISGTAAIRGHETVAAGSLEQQLDCTLENLRLISATGGLGEQLAGEREAERFFKIYLRHAADFDKVRSYLERTLLRPADKVIYLQAEICRAELNVEIEVTLSLAMKT